MQVLNKELRRRIIDMVVAGRDGHIPSSFSILDIITVLFRDYLKYDAKNPTWSGRDYFILSKGHGCLALYVVLAKHGFLTDEDLSGFCQPDGILGEHPDCTKVPGAEASTGSLGHGMPFATGIALGLKMRQQSNRVFVLCGDGECQEGTIWEAANVAHNRKLGNMCVIVDWNRSGEQLMPLNDFPAKWKAFGWNVLTADGHDEASLKAALDQVSFDSSASPTVILADTVKGKGVPAIEGHGQWHHRIPTPEDYTMLMEALS